MTGRRWIIVALLAAGVVVNYVDRIMTGSFSGAFLVAGTVLT